MNSLNIVRAIKASWMQGKIETLAKLYIEAGMQTETAYRTAAYVIGKRKQKA